MKQSEINSVIKQLRDDSNYFGEVGRRFLSTSDIKNLVSDPSSYGKLGEDNVNLLKGTYLHRRILQPELAQSFTIINATTRTTNVYKEAVAAASIEGMPKPVFLLEKEVEELELLANKIETNDEFVDALQGGKQPFEVEEPAIGELFGYWFKGKADRINSRRGFVADLKTTRSLSSFVYNFYDYGYHVQAYVYNKLFNLPVRFYVISKEDGKLGVYDVSDKALERAEEYIKWGLERLEMYYGENPTSDINQYYDYSVL
jgi:hypothetical protein